MTADEFDNELEQMLNSYSLEVENAVDTAAEKCAKQVNKVIKKHCTFGGTGEYIRAFRIEKVKSSTLTIGRRWYVKKPYFRLTHLLEDGHAKRNGGRTKAYPHIKYGEEFAKANYENYVKEEVKKIAD